MSIKVERDETGYQDEHGNTLPVDIIAAPSLSGRTLATFSYFNDGDGLTVAVGAMGNDVQIANLSRADTLALIAELNKLFNDGSMQA